MVGGGAMGGAIVEGILAGVPDAQVTVVEANDERAEIWRRRGDVRVAGLTEAVSDADVIFLAVKPDQITDVLGQAAESVNPSGVVVSIAAGVPIAVLERHAPDGVAVARAMPNTPVRVGRGVVGLVAGTTCSAEQLQQVVRLLDPVSTVIVMDEALIDSLTATSGSGPAYVFYLAESMMKAAMDLGLDRSTASTLVAETIAGSALLLASEPDDPAALRAAVTSPGGTTAAAIGVFDSEGLARTIENGMRAAHGRAGEMSAERADHADQG